MLVHIRQPNPLIEQYNKRLYKGIGLSCRFQRFMPEHLPKSLDSQLWCFCMNSQPARILGYPVTLFAVLAPNFLNRYNVAAWNNFFRLCSFTHIVHLPCYYMVMGYGIRTRPSRGMLGHPPCGDRPQVHHTVTCYATH